MIVLQEFRVASGRTAPQLRGAPLVSDCKVHKKHETLRAEAVVDISHLHLILMKNGHAAVRGSIRKSVVVLGCENFEVITRRWTSVSAHQSVLLVIIFN